MRENGLCTVCGKENPTPGKSRCPACTERGNANRKENRQYRKRIGICVRCGKHEAEPHKTLCYECIGKEQDSYNASQRTDRQREYDRNKKRTLTAKRKAAGLCPKCGKQKSDSGKICENCKAYLARYRERNRKDIIRSERVSYGICYICGKHPTMKNRGVCDICYRNRVKTLPAMWSNMNNEYFRQLNYARICMARAADR